MSPRSLFISADIEGCAGVSSQFALGPDRWEWAAARMWMTREVAAVAEAGLACGYEAVVVADGHGNSHNIDPDGLPDDVSLIRSWPRPYLQMQGVELPGIAACAFIGYHAGPASQNSILSHIYHGGAFRSMRLNGEPCSEGYLNAAFAGRFGCPVIFVSGDQQTLDESRLYAPGAVRMVTKESVGWRSQKSLPPRQVCRQLSEAASEAFSRPLPAPFVLEGDLELELELVNQGSAEMLSYLKDVRRTGPFEVSVGFDSIEVLMSFMSFITLYTPTGAPAI